MADEHECRTSQSEKYAPGGRKGVSSSDGICKSAIKSQGSAVIRRKDALPHVAVCIEHAGAQYRVHVGIKLLSCGGMNTAMMLAKQRNAHPSPK